MTIGKLLGTLGCGWMIAVGGVAAIAVVPAQAGAAGASIRPSAITVACPGPECPYTPPSANEQGAASDVLTRMNLERAAPVRGYTYQGSRTTLPPYSVATGAQQTAQAAAEWEASHGTVAAYGGPRPAGYTWGTGGNAGGGTDSAGVDDAIMHSYGHAVGVLSAAPTEVAVGAACAPNGVIYVTELFYDPTETEWHAGQARYQAEISQNNVYVTSGGTVTTVTDATGTGPATNVFPQQPIVAGVNALYATGVDWTCNGPVYGSDTTPGSGLPAPVVGMASTPTGGGYWLADSAGAVSAHGSAQSYGSMAGQPLNKPITHIVATPDGRGYWLVAADGGTFAFGDAGFYGSMGGQPLNAPVVDIAPTPDGRGYWLVASDGGIFAFGDAGFYGSMGGQPLNRPVVGMAVDPATGGYWLVATDGGIFAFGAPFHGSTGDLSLNRPVNGMAAEPNGQGYWLVASDGGIFAFGGAPFYGSTGGMTLVAPIVGMATDPATGGYWLVAADGGVFSYNAPFYGAD